MQQCSNVFFSSGLNGFPLWNRFIRLTTAISISQVTDAEKRTVLGDALFLIRLPTMNMDEFKECAAKSEILSDQEARDLFTHIVGMNPNREMKFTNKERVGTFGMLEFTATDVTPVTNNVYFPYGAHCQLYFEGLGAGETVEISEVQFCNPADFPIDEIQFTTGNVHNQGSSADKIAKIPEKLCHGYSVYRSTFKPAFKIADLSAVQIHFKTKTYSGSGTASLISGERSQRVTLQGKSVDVTIQHSYDAYWGNYEYDKWYFMLGMKMKVVQKS